MLRAALGCLFFYAGIVKIADPAWSAAEYLGNAKTFAGFYHWLATAQNIGWVNFANEWGLTLIGISLIFGIFARWASLGGISLMLLYYFPVLQFPFVSPHAFLIDEHIIYLLVFILFFFFRAGKFWGLDGLLDKRNKSKRHA